MLILAIEQLGFQWLERAIMFLVGVIGVSYAIEMFLSKPPWAPIVKHMILPEIHSSSIYIAVSMLGATVMPHVIYLHSALVQHRVKEDAASDHPEKWLLTMRHLRYELWDVLAAMNGAWLINSAMIVMAAAVFYNKGTDFTFDEAHLTLHPLLPAVSGTAFALALLFSGLSS